MLGTIQKLRNAQRVGGGHRFCDKALRFFEGRGGGLSQVLRNAMKSLLKRKTTRKTQKNAQKNE